MNFLANLLILMLGFQSGILMAAGLGLQLGSTGAIIGKEYRDEPETWKGSMGWDLKGQTNLVLTGDYVIQEKDMGQLRNQDIRGYYGAGIYFSTSSVIAGRIPLGLSWLPNSKNLEVFIELAPSLAIYPSTEVYVTANIGALWYLSP